MPKPTPMPEIEIGDWVRLVYPPNDVAVIVEGTDFDAGDGEKLPYGGGSWFMPADVIEIRKADGRIWRREEPSG